MDTPSSGLLPRMNGSLMPAGLEDARERPCGLTRPCGAKKVGGRACPGRFRYRGPLLRRTKASTTIMATQDQIAALTLKKDTPIESRKMTDRLRPRIR
jgi:hypothetical protein